MIYSYSRSNSFPLWVCIINCEQAEVLLMRNSCSLSYLSHRTRKNSTLVPFNHLPDHVLLSATGSLQRETQKSVLYDSKVLLTYYTLSFTMTSFFLPITRSCFPHCFLCVCEFNELSILISLTSLRWFPSGGFALACCR